MSILLWHISANQVSLSEYSDLVYEECHLIDVVYLFRSKSINIQLSEIKIIKKTKTNVEYLRCLLIYYDNKIAGGTIKRLVVGKVSFEQNCTFSIFEFFTSHLIFVLEMRSAFTCEFCVTAFVIQFSSGGVDYHLIVLLDTFIFIHTCKEYFKYYIIMREK